MNSYVIHAIASTIDAIRESGEMGYVHANGGYATKQACGIYGCSPPSKPFRRVNVQSEIDENPLREVDETPNGTATIEGDTVMHNREGPETALISSLMSDGRRALTTTDDQMLMAEMMQQEYIGRSAAIDSDGSISLVA